MRIIVPEIFLSHTSLIIEGETSLSIIDPGFDNMAGNGASDPSPTRLVFELSESLKKPIQTIFITHSHIDHIYNTRKYLDKYQNIVCIGHAKSPYLKRLHQGGVSVLMVNGDMEVTIDGIDFSLMNTPGHSKPGDDLTVYIPEKKIVQVGDLFQPQGNDYAKADSVSPVPSFYQGRQYEKSLETLMNLNFDFLVTGHGEVLGRDAGKRGLELTRKILKRIDELAYTLVRENPMKDDDEICEWVYDTIVYERNFDKNQAEWRKGEGGRKNFYYKRFDLPGIQYFVERARKE